MAAIQNKDLNIQAAAGMANAATTQGTLRTMTAANSAGTPSYRMDIGYNPEEGHLTYNSMGGGNSMTGGANTMTGAQNAASTSGSGNVMTQNTAAGNGQVGIRNAMTGMGLNNDLIGYNADTGYVTYNGNNFIKAGSVNNGVSYASADDFAKAAQSYLGGQGLQRLRDTLVSRGISNDRIGYNADTGSVTLDGKDVYNPQHVLDGVSYASERDINALTNTAYANIGDPIVQATSYVPGSGLSNAVNWSDGKLMVGGQQVPVTYVDAEGKAYARQSDIDAALAKVKETAGITGNQAVYDNWDSKYGDRINSALDAILNREKWSYDPYTDPAYLAYRDAYTREGNRAYQDAYAQMSANTGGYGSSAGMTAAGQQLNYYMQQLGDRIPELEQNSYYRYLNDQQLNAQALESLLGVADGDYNKAYQANRDSINDTNTANYYNYLRDKDIRDYNRSVYESDRAWPYQEAALQMQNELTKNAVQQSNIDTSNYERNAALDLQAKEFEYRSAAISDVLARYSYSADPNKQISAEDAAILGLSPKEDGTYPTIAEINMAYMYLQDMANSQQYQMYQQQQTQQMQQQMREQQQQERAAQQAAMGQSDLMQIIQQLAGK